MKLKKLALWVGLLAGIAGMQISEAKAQISKKNENDLLIKLANSKAYSNFLLSIQDKSTKVEPLGGNWVRVQGPANLMKTFGKTSAIEYVQPNYPIRLLTEYKIQDPLRRAAMIRFMKKRPDMRIQMPADNPEIPAVPAQGTGADPQISKQWGILDAGAPEAWKKTKGSSDMIVAVLDTGVDYTHEDLLPNMWRNPGEIPGNGIDDDNNGYVDDIVGWDFVSDDNKPYDLAVDPMELLAGGGNPGHGTHCAGNVAARGDNGLGIAGVAPNVKIMALRFISEKGGGTTADAIKSIHYAVDNGAKILSNSWGSEGENPNDAEENKALRDAIQYAESKGVLFVAAAGNGHSGRGYDNDTDPRPAYPASYDFDTVLSVAALDVRGQLGSFSNWGRQSVDIGAPGVAVYSTVVGGGYTDTVFDKYGFKVTWDGTSMATPHVAGAAALYWSLHPEKTFKEVKEAIIASAMKIPSLSGKAVSEGKLDVKKLVEQP